MMLSLIKHLLILALFTLKTLQAGLHERGQEGHISLPRKPNPNLIRDGFRAKQRIFAKLGWDMLPRDLVPRDQDFPFNPNMTMMDAPIYQNRSFDVSNLVKARVQIGSANAVPERYHSEYLTPISIGTPPQLLHMDFDTGSADFWVFSSLQPDNETDGHDGIFQPARSATFRSLRAATWKIMYGDKSYASGIVGTDRVEVGGAVVRSQAIELAKAVSDSFVEDEANDGLVGLAFSNINNVKPTRQRSLFDNLKASLPKPVFTVNLLEDGSGTFDFGYINQSHIPAGRRLSYIPIDARYGFWAFESAAFAINGQVTQRAAIATIGGRAAPAIADTGTSLVIVDSVVAWSYYRAVEGAGYSNYYGGYVFPCASTLPSLGIAIGNKKMGGKLLTISGKLISYAQVDSIYCYGAVQGNGGYGLQVLGDVLFRASFVVFDGTVGSPRLGFVGKDVV